MYIEYQQVKSMVEKGLVGFVRTIENKVYPLAIINNDLGYQRRRKWYLFGDGMPRVRIKALLPPRDMDRQCYNLIAKFRRLAHAGNLHNDFVEDCRKLPASHEEWLAEGKKDPCGYHLTVGCPREGEVITLTRIARAGYAGIVRELRQAIQTHTAYGMHQFDFAGYNTHFSYAIQDGVGNGYLSLEYRDCGNGHYYRLINEETFIYVEND